MSDLPVPIDLTQQSENPDFSHVPKQSINTQHNDFVHSSKPPEQLSHELDLQIKDLDQKYGVHSSEQKATLFEDTIPTIEIRNQFVNEKSVYENLKLPDYWGVLKSHFDWTPQQVATFIPKSTDIEDIKSLVNSAGDDIGLKEAYYIGGLVTGVAPFYVANKIGLAAVDALVKAIEITDKAVEWTKKEGEGNLYSIKINQGIYGDQTVVIPNYAALSTIGMLIVGSAGGVAALSGYLPYKVALAAAMGANYAIRNVPESDINSLLKKYFPSSNVVIEGLPHGTKDLEEMVLSGIQDLFDGKKGSATRKFANALWNFLTGSSKTEAKEVPNSNFKGRNSRNEFQPISFNQQYQQYIDRQIKYSNVTYNTIKKQKRPVKVVKQKKKK